MKLAILLTFEVPEPDGGAEAAAAIVKAIDPPRLPHFDGHLRITVDPWASAVERFLDASDEEQP